MVTIQQSFSAVTYAVTAVSECQVAVILNARVVSGLLILMLGKFNLLHLIININLIRVFSSTIIFIRF